MIPYKAICLAVTLFLGGSLLIVIGSLLLTGFIDAAVSANLFKNVYFYIAQYPVCWTAQSGLHITPGRPDHSDTNLTSLGSIHPCYMLLDD